jgi:hypothetical protein
MTSPSVEQTTTIVIFGASGDLTRRKLIPSSIATLPPLPPISRQSIMPNNR